MLSNDPLRAISFDRTADSCRRRNAYPPRPFRGCECDTQNRRGSPTPGPEDGGEGATFPDPAVPTEASGAGERRTAGGGSLVDDGLHSQALPALGASSLDHQSAPARSHTDEEPVGPSSAAIVGLERSLHCLMESLRKVEPAMLSGIARKVKTGRFWRALSRGLACYRCGLSGAANSCPAESAFSGSVAPSVTLLLTMLLVSCR